MAASRPTLPPSGEQHELRFGPQCAVATEVGATLRSFTIGDVDVLDGFAIGDRSTAGRGQVLAPWPNRLDAGRYSFEGRVIRKATRPFPPSLADRRHVGDAIAVYVFPAEPDGGEADVFRINAS